MKGNSGNRTAHKCGVPRDRETLTRLYITECKTVRQIARLFNVKHPSVLRALSALSIPRRIALRTSTNGTAPPKHTRGWKRITGERHAWREFQFGPSSYSGRDRLVSFNGVHEEQQRKSIADSLVYDDPLEILCAIETAMEAM